MMRRITKGAVANLLVAFILSGGCADNAETAPDSGAIKKCAPGLKPMGPACVPIFDECQDDEVPMLGGGCKRVGVRECLDGWGLAGPPDWKCKPIGPPRTCLKGWEKVAGGWCEPILPKTKCPAGTMEKIGYSTCQPIGDCGSGTWGNIKTTASTIYVNGAYSGMGSNGSAAKPYKTIAEALSQATAGDHIAVAAGTYNKNITILRKVTLEGRCAKKVIIVGGSSYFAVEMKSWANGAILRDVTITGAGACLGVNGVDVTIERVATQGCEGHGIDVDSGGTLTFRDGLVAGNRGVGIILGGSKATLERTVVRDTRGRASDNDFGWGIQAAVAFGQPSDLTLRDSLVAGNREVGLILYSSKALLERTVVRDTRKQFLNGEFGVGIQASVDFGQTLPSDFRARDSLVAGNRTIGIALGSSKATLERTVVRDTYEQASDKNGGTGIVATVQSGQSGPSELTLHDSLVVGNRNSGIDVVSSKATLERTVVRDTRERVSDKKGGKGIEASVLSGQIGPSVLTLRDSLVAGNRTVGLVLGSSKATLQRTVVRDTRERVSDKNGGAGIQVQIQSGQSLSSELTVQDSLVEGNRELAIGVVSSKAIIERTVVRDTLERTLDNGLGKGIHAWIQPGQIQPPELTVRDSVVSGNRTVGIDLRSTKATLERTVVCDTRKRASKNDLGMGILVGCEPGQNLPSVLTVRDSLIARNRVSGIVLSSSKATVERTIVRDTREDASDKELGTGIVAMVQPDQTLPPDLTVRDSLVSGNRNAGLLLLGSKGKLTRCAVSDTRKDGKGQYGDGVGAADKSTLVVEDSLVERSARAGFLFIDSGGSVNRSLIRGNVLAIDLERGATPFIGDDNQMVDNQINHVTLGRGLETAPIPYVPILGGPDAGPTSGPDAGVGAQ